jgi:hypothetical protein
LLVGQVTRYLVSLRKVLSSSAVRWSLIITRGDSGENGSQRILVRFNSETYFKLLFRPKNGSETQVTARLTTIAGFLKRCDNISLREGYTYTQWPLGESPTNSWGVFLSHPHKSSFTD